jgi:hypothetical protein
MRQVLTTFVLAAAAALCPTAQASAALPGLSFGRSGGNIRPYTVSISASGRVTSNGMTVRNRQVSATALRSLRALVLAARLSRLPALTLCPGTLPDFATVWVQAGGRRVAVRGECRPELTRLYLALVRAVDG